METPFVDVHTHNEAAAGVISLRSYVLGRDDIPAHAGFFSAGIHPWYAAQTDIECGLEYLRAAPAAAIGEIGLDYRRGAERELQESVFRAQLKIAQMRNLPVVIHCVKAYNGILPLLKDYELPAVIFHGYTGSKEQAARLVKAGYYISFGQTSLGSPATVEALRSLPAENIFAETDESALPISDIYARMAAARNIETDELKSTIYSNFQRIFR